jgi:hypothetical protein
VPVDDSPVDGGTKIQGEAFETLVVDLGRSSGKFGQSSDCLADVRAGCDIGIQQFSEQRTVGKIHVFFQLGMFGGLFRRASRCGVQCGNSGSRKRFGGTRSNFGFQFAGCFPVVTSEETVEV